jgi:phage baseplate assembly protein gpV
MSDTPVDFESTITAPRTQSYTGYQQPNSGATEFDAHAFVIKSIIGKLATTAVVQVIAVTNSGGVSPVGFVDVQPMVNQMDGAGNPTPHATIHNMPYVRLQGGTNAIIMDPAVDDIGVAVFCSRDISQVKRTKAISNPGTEARFDWADGIFIGLILNGLPTQYIQYSNTGIALKTPNTFTVTANNTVINSPVTVNGATTINGNVATTGTLTNNTHAVGSTHDHTGVTTGTGVSGPPV